MGNLLGKGIDIRVFEYHTKTVLLFEGFLDFLTIVSDDSGLQITEPPCSHGGAEFSHPTEEVQSCPIGVFREAQEIRKAGEAFFVRPSGR